MARKPWQSKRRDANEATIVAELRDFGCTVTLLDEPCDLLVGYRGLNWLFEVKEAEAKPSASLRTQKGKLTPNQERFFRTWRGQVAQIHNAQEALEIMTQ